jgi:hypothetical protein
MTQDSVKILLLKSMVFKLTVTLIAVKEYLYNNSKAKRPSVKMAGVLISIRR